MRPIRAFLFILTSLSLFLLVSYYLPLPNLTPKLSTGATIDSVLLVPDSIQASIHLTDIADSIQFSETNKEYCANEIIFPFGDSTVLYSFFRKIKNAQPGNAPLRIMYFGDSQIEGDRITSTIRQFFQHKFGGEGIGLVPLERLYSSLHAVSIDLSDNWQYLSIRDKSVKIPISSVTFKDALLKPGQSGWLRIKQIDGDRKLPVYTRIRIFYKSLAGFKVTVTQRGKIVYQEKVNGTDEMSVIQFNFSQSPNELEFIFQAKDRLIVTGLSFENPSGILVDNIPLRGFSFPPFSKLDKKALEETTQLINPGLLVLHFGVNLAPYVRDEYNYYRKQLVNEIKYLQQMIPGVPVLLVGISDMAKKEGNEMVSYPNIKAIKKAQLDAARRCGCVYWDLENYMGGSGSMVKWVNSNPPLGSKDYIHFSLEGAEKIGQHLSKILLDEYQKSLTDTIK